MGNIRNQESLIEFQLLVSALNLCVHCSYCCCLLWLSRTPGTATRTSTTAVEYNHTVIWRTQSVSCRDTAIGEGYNQQQPGAGIVGVKGRYMAKALNNTCCCGLWDYLSSLDSACSFVCIYRGFLNGGWWMELLIGGGVVFSLY